MVRRTRLRETWTSFCKIISLFMTHGQRGARGFMGNLMVAKLKNLFLLQQVNLKGISQSKTLPTSTKPVCFRVKYALFWHACRNNPSKSDFIKDKVRVTRKLKDSKCSRVQRKKSPLHIYFSILISTDLQLLIYTVMYGIQTKPCSLMIAFILI